MFVGTEDLRILGRCAGKSGKQMEMHSFRILLSYRGRVLAITVFLGCIDAFLITELKYSKLLVRFPRPLVSCPHHNSNFRVFSSFCDRFSTLRQMLVCNSQLCRTSARVMVIDMHCACPLLHSLTLQTNFSFFHRVSHCSQKWSRYHWLSSVFYRLRPNRFDSCTP